MPKKTVKEKQVEEVRQAQVVKTDIFWGESYTSFLLGVIIVVFVAALLVIFLKKRNTTQKPRQEITSAKTQIEYKENPKTNQETQTGKYTVVLEDSLWKISEKFYKSGYNWVDIAKANKLIKDPDSIDMGMILLIPVLSQKDIVQENSSIKNINNNQSAISGKSYTVIHGDMLWRIALRAYGDGYRWVDIARVNKLANPNIIHAGNILLIPR